MRVRYREFVSCSAIALIPLLFGACSEDDRNPLQACLEASSLSLDRRDWKPSSRPVTERLSPLSDSALRDADRLGLIWYSVQGAIRCADLFPVEAGQGRPDMDGLGIILLPNPAATTPWAGLAQSFPMPSIDLAQAEFIEIWVNDFNRFHGDQASAGQGKELRIDLGRFSEDAVWDPRTPPAPANGRLDFEDANSDGQRTPLEDLGLDGFDSLFVDHGDRVMRVPRASPARARELAGSFPEPRPEVPRPTGEQTPYPVSTESDPQGDDYLFYGTSPGYNGPLIDRIQLWRHINGTEGNQQLDTEDLNDDFALNINDDYFEYAVPLSGTAYTVSDVRQDFGVTDPRNGWRLLRIPLADASRRVVGTPDMSVVRSARIWFAGFSDTTEFWIAGFRLGSAP